MASERIERLATSIHTESEIIRKAQEKKDLLRDQLARAMKDEGESEVRIPAPNGALFDLKAKLSSRKSKVTDKEQLAGDLGVAVSAINLPFLLRMVEEGRLTASRYEDYVDEQYSDSASVRAVKA